LSSQKRIVQLFIVACSLISILTVIPLVSFFGLYLDFIVDGDDGIIKKLRVSLLFIPVIWGVTLFVRYIRLFQEKLNSSKKRLWIETIVLNLVCFFVGARFLFEGEVSFFSFFIAIQVLWTGVAIVLAVSALKTQAE